MEYVENMYVLIHQTNEEARWEYVSRGDGGKTRQSKVEKHDQKGPEDVTDWHARTHKAI